jgi:exodeoxyribonuclease-3
LNTENPDIICVQEIKVNEADFQTELNLHQNEIKNFTLYSNSGEIKGYSGVSVFVKNSTLQPEYVKTQIGIQKYDREGRILELGFENFVLFNVYFPNGQKDEERLQYKLDFYKDFFEYCEILKMAGKKIIICGDYNIAHTETDLKRPKENENYSGFLPIERKCLDKLVNDGYVDAFRHFDKSPNKYTWWSYMFQARAKNIGWRIDYFFVTENILNDLKKSEIYPQILGSDHAPLSLEFSS